MNKPPASQKATQGDGVDTGHFSATMPDFECASFDWWRGIVDFVAGPNHGLIVGVIEDGDHEFIEIIGNLPKPLRKGLRRYAPCHDRDFVIEWIFRQDGYGTRYELNGLSDLLNRLAERKALLNGGLV